MFLLQFAENCHILILAQSILPSAHIQLVQFHFLSVLFYLLHRLPFQLFLYAIGSDSFFNIRMLFAKIVRNCFGSVSSDFLEKLSSSLLSQISKLVNELL